MIYIIFLSLSNLFHQAWFSLHLITATNGNILFFFMASIPLYVYRSFLIQSSADRHLGSFHVFATVTSIMNIGVYVSFKISVFNLFSYISRSRIAGSYGSPGGAC